MVQNLTVSLNSDYSGSQFKLAKVLLNGNNICMVCWLVVAEECFLLANHDSLFLEERGRPSPASGFGRSNICSMDKRVIPTLKPWRGMNRR